MCLLWRHGSWKELHNTEQWWNLPGNCNISGNCLILHFLFFIWAFNVSGYIPLVYIWSFVLFLYYQSLLSSPALSLAKTVWTCLAVVVFIRRRYLALHHISVEWEWISANFISLLLPFPPIQPVYVQSPATPIAWEMVDPTPDYLPPSELGTKE